MEQQECLDQQVLLALSEQLDSLASLVHKERKELRDRGEVLDHLELLVCLDNLVQQAGLVTLVDKVLQDHKDRQDSLGEEVCWLYLLVIVSVSCNSVQYLVCI